MSKAARAIIIENNQMLVMQRRKTGTEYYTLVGGRANDSEALEDALKREVMEETGLTVTSAELVFIEEHRAPSNEQYIFVCKVAPHGQVALQEMSEENKMNEMGMNIHTPQWVSVSIFPRLAFRSPQLQTAIVAALKRGFPKTPIKI